MTPEAKKSTWLSVLLSGTIIAGLSIAYSAGVKTSAGAKEFEIVHERVGDVEEDFAVCKVEFETHEVRNEKEYKEINSHLHRIDLRLSEQTQILKRIERKDP